MADPFPRSPLRSSQGAFADVDQESGGALAIRELPFTTQLTLRVDPDSAAARAVANVIGGPLPLVPNTAECRGALDVLWMGPDEWLLVSWEPTPSVLEPELRAACGDGFASVVDVSAQRTIIELTGPAARTVLARGCALDLHPSRLGAGRCAQTLLGQAQVILQPLASEPDVLRVFVRASFARYLADWLLDACTEERLAVEGVLDGELALRTP